MPDWQLFGCLPGSECEESLRFSAHAQELNPVMPRAVLKTLRGIVRHSTLWFRQSCGLCLALWKSVGQKVPSAGPAY